MSPKTEHALQGVYIWQGRLTYHTVGKKEIAISADK